MAEPTKAVKPAGSKPRKRFVGSKSAKPSKPGTSAATIRHQIPEDILLDAQLNAAIKQLPSNYSFEIHKTIHHVRKNNATMVALQMPEGLQMFACTIADIIERAFVVPMDQTTIKTLYVFVEIGIDATHLTQTIRLNFPSDRQQFHENLIDSEETNRLIPAGTKIGSTSHLRIEGPPSTEQTGETGPSTSHEPTRLALVSTIQFVAALQRLKEDLTGESFLVDPTRPSGLEIPSKSLDADSPVESGTKLWSGRYDATIPRSKPLSPGEILGCTAPLLEDIDALIYLGDGRFHLESIMIANPSVPAFRYDPYSKKLTRERYDHREMQAVRDDAVQTARKSISALAHGSPSDDAPTPLWGVVLGTLGRQGNFKQLQAITHQLQASSTPIPYIQILLSELSPAKLALFNPHISTFIQTACPRLSIDWGYAFERPLLSPYETAVAVGKTPSWMPRAHGGEGEVRNGERANEKQQEVGSYPMDFYSAGSPWAISRTAAAF
ncbi:hypothetical protein DXG03_003478 [Asterophora parasitica]|uniref:2-(3-amino-3-carboxypropyl)histidine synthase subunit 1 n=1 Tax=Asterophora parasitica TaxID=117018 RepID=A0A9P7GCZ9_9AGAR|nr:hypothetical protein DXG03_003478 [Asterophora parasitica]